MRIAFGAPTLYQPAVPSNLPAATTTPASTTTGTDFRDSLPPLAFSGISFKRSTESETPEMDAALTYVLQHKIDALTSKVSKQLKAQNDELAKAEPDIDFYEHMRKSPYCVYIREPDGQSDYVGLNEYHLKNLSQSLANRALRKHHTKIPGMTPENIALAAQYGCLLLISQPGVVDLIQRSHPWDGVFTRSLSVGHDFKQAKETKIYELVLFALEYVQNWLYAKNTPDKILRIKKEHDNIEALKQKNFRLENKSSHTEDELNAWAEAGDAVTSGNKVLQEMTGQLGEPVLPDLNLDAADNTQIALARIEAERRLDKPGNNIEG